MTASWSCAFNWASSAWDKVPIAWISERQCPVSASNHCPMLFRVMSLPPMRVLMVSFL
jgi:hypothetical protein